MALFQNQSLVLNDKGSTLHARNTMRRTVKAGRDTNKGRFATSFATEICKKAESCKEAQLQLSIRQLNVEACKNEMYVPKERS